MSLGPAPSAGRGQSATAAATHTINTSLTHALHCSPLLLLGRSSGATFPPRSPPASRPPSPSCRCLFLSPAAAAPRRSCEWLTLICGLKHARPFGVTVLFACAAPQGKVSRKLQHYKERHVTCGPGVTSSCCGQHGCGGRQVRRQVRHPD